MNKPQEYERTERGVEEFFTASEILRMNLRACTERLHQVLPKLPGRWRATLSKKTPFTNDTEVKDLTVKVEGNLTLKPDSAQLLETYLIIVGRLDENSHTKTIWLLEDGSVVIRYDNAFYTTHASIYKKSETEQVIESWGTSAGFDYGTKKIPDIDLEQITGIFGNLIDMFENTEDPNIFLPTQLKAISIETPYYGQY